MKKKNTVIISAVCFVMAIAAGIAVWLIATPDNEPKKSVNNGGIEEITYQRPSTELFAPAPAVTNPPSTAAPTTVLETTTQSKEEYYVEQFMGEANTYSSTIETTTFAPGSKVYFNVVTNGTVSDDNSLEGLEGTAKTIGEVILAAGFRYDKNQHIFYSESQSWQRNFGFTPIYDASAALMGMYYDTMRLKFNYDNKDWMIQIWKGRYGITTGGEMGVYYKDPGTDVSFYACVPDEKMLTMSFALYRGDDLYMTRGPERHWWLTGFKIFDMIAPKDLTMHATFFMDNDKMADALEKSLKELNFIEGTNYQRLGLTMTIIWN